MPTLTQSESIILGKVLEKCLAPMLTEAGYKFVFSEAYEELLTRPDYLIYDHEMPIASIAVTCTQDNETMNKKRWRYIDEVFQLKSYFGNDILVINCEFGNHNAYVQSEVNLANAFFDSSIYIYDFVDGPAFLDYAIDFVKTSAANVDGITSSLMASKLWKSVKSDFVKLIQKIINERETIVESNRLKRIWNAESISFREILSDAKRKNFAEPSTYLRYCVLKGIIADPLVMKRIISAIQGNQKIDEETEQVCKQIDIEVATRIGGAYITDPKLITTVKSGMSYGVYQSIEEVILSYEPLRYAVRDLRNQALVEKMYEITSSVIENRSTLCDELFNAFRDRQYKGIAHNRTWLLDMILVYWDIPTNYLNRMYAQTFGREGITTKVEHYISKTDMGINFFSNDLILLDFCHNLANLLYVLAASQNVDTGKNVVIKRYNDKRVVSIGNMHFVNPMQRYVELLLLKYGISYHKTGIPSAITGLPGIPNSMSNIHEIYQFEYKGKEYWLKTIAAYDGVKDKTREMAARGRMLQYASPDSQKRNINLLFVYDGKWSNDLQRLLYIAGWKDIVPIFEFDKFLAGL